MRELLEEKLEEPCSYYVEDSEYLLWPASAEYVELEVKLLFSKEPREGGDDVTTGLPSEGARGGGVAAGTTTGGGGRRDSGDNNPEADANVLQVEKMLLQVEKRISEKNVAGTPEREGPAKPAGARASAPPRLEMGGSGGGRLEMGESGGREKAGTGSGEATGDGGAGKTAPAYSLEPHTEKVRFHFDELFRRENGQAFLGSKYFESISFSTDFLTFAV